MSGFYGEAGVQIRRVERVTNSIPQSTQGVLFTVTGRVKIVDIIGEVTSQIQNQPNNIKLIANPTVGADVDLCVTVDIDNDTVGTLYSLSGTFANAMIKTTSGAFEGQANRFAVANGTLDLSCSASSTGAIKWTVLYKPLDAGSEIVAA